MPNREQTNKAKPCFQMAVHVKIRRAMVSISTDRFSHAGWQRCRAVRFWRRLYGGGNGDAGGRECRKKHSKSNKT